MPITPYFTGAENRDTVHLAHLKGAADLTDIPIEKHTRSAKIPDNPNHTTATTQSPHTCENSSAVPVISAARIRGPRGFE